MTKRNFLKKLRDANDFASVIELAEKCGDGVLWNTLREIALEKALKLAKSPKEKERVILADLRSSKASRKALLGIINNNSTEGIGVEAMRTHARIVYPKEYKTILWKRFETAERNSDIFELDKILRELELTKDEKGARYIKYTILSIELKRAKAARDFDRIVEIGDKFKEFGYNRDHINAYADAFEIAKNAGQFQKIVKNTPRGARVNIAASSKLNQSINV